MFPVIISKTAMLLFLYFIDKKQQCAILLIDQKEIHTKTILQIGDQPFLALRNGLKYLIKHKKILIFSAWARLKYILYFFFWYLSDKTQLCTNLAAITSQTAMHTGQLETYPLFCLTKFQIFWFWCFCFVFKSLLRFL